MKHLLIIALLLLTLKSFSQFQYQIILLPSNYNDFNVSCHGASDGSITAIVIGEPGFTYLWSTNDKTAKIDSLPAGQYWLRITDINGYTTDTTIELIEPVAPIADIWISQNISSCYSNDGRIEVEMYGGSPPYTYSWANDPNCISSFQKEIQVGMYIVSVTDAENCTATDSIGISAPDCPPLFITFGMSGINCNGFSNGIISAEVTGGFPPYTFNWSNNDTTQQIDNLPGGWYRLTVTDAIGGTLTDSIELFEPPPLDINVFQTALITTYGGADGKLEQNSWGGVPPYSWLWGNGTITATTYDLDSCTAGTYGVTVTDAWGCTAWNGITITQPPLFKITSANSPGYNGYNVSCAGGNNGRINISLTGGVQPYRYCDLNDGIWKNFNGNIQNLHAGNYTFRFKDALNVATIDSSFILSEPDTMVLELGSDTFPNGHHVSCYDCFNGSIITSLTGGVATFNYEWSNGLNDTSLINLGPGEYSLVVSDLNGCQVEKTIELTSPDDDWTMYGNTGTNPDSEFVGTADSTDFVIRTNNVERLRIMGNGNLRLSSLSGTGTSLIASDSYGNLSRSTMMSFQETTGGHPEIYSFGRAPLSYPYNIPGNFCNMPQNFPTAYQFNGMLQSYGNSATGGQTNILQMGFDGQNGVIELLGINSGPIPPRLLLNYNCGADVFVGNSNSGDLTASHNFFTNGSASIGTSVASVHRLNIQGGNVQIGFNQVADPGTNEAYLFLGDQNHFIKSKSGEGISIGTYGHPEAIKIEQNDGKIGIGISEFSNWDGDYKLYVKDGIRTEKVKVDVAQTTGWADYVFHKDYKLRSIGDLKKFIDKNGHLPGIPSAEEVTKTGIDVAEMQAKLLEKIEELTLYVIELNKKNEELKEKYEILLKK
jgi:hypothetical protein